MKFRTCAASEGLLVRESACQTVGEPGLLGVEIQRFFALCAPQIALSGANAGSRMRCVKDADFVQETPRKLLFTRGNLGLIRRESLAIFVAACLLALGYITCSSDAISYCPQGETGCVERDHVDCDSPQLRPMPPGFMVQPSRSEGCQSSSRFTSKRQHPIKNSRAEIGIIDIDNGFSQNSLPPAFHLQDLQPGTDMDSNGIGNISAYAADRRSRELTASFEEMVDKPVAIGCASLSAADRSKEQSHPSGALLAPKHLVVQVSPLPLKRIGFEYVYSKPDGFGINSKIGRFEEGCSRQTTEVRKLEGDFRGEIFLLVEDIPHAYVAPRSASNVVNAGGSTLAIQCKVASIGALA